MIPSLSGIAVDLHLFVSYSHKDHAFVRRLVHDLRAHGVPVYVDEDAVRAGDSIRRRLETIMDKTDVFLIVLSPDSRSSNWVQEELDLIQDRTIREEAIVIPLLIRRAKATGFLKGKKSIAFTRYERGLEELLASLRAWDYERRDKLLDARVRSIEEASEKSPARTSKKYAEVGRLAIAMGRYGEAARIFRRSLEVWPGNWDAHFLLAVALIKAQRFDEAEAILEEALESRVQKARAHYNLACVFSRRAEVGVKTPREELQRLLGSCLENLRRSVSLGFVSWLKRSAGRTDPVSDILNDPDLVFARGRHSEIEALLKSLEGKYHQVRKERLIYGGSGGCLVGETRVVMADGTRMPIECIQSGLFVSSPAGQGSSGPTRVWRTMRFWAKRGVTINGTLAVTDRQPLYSQGRWKAAGSLKVGDTVAGHGGTKIVITTIEPWTGPRPVYQLGLEGTPVYVAEDILIHNGKRQ